MVLNLGQVSHLKLVILKGHGRSYNLASAHGLQMFFFLQNLRKYTDVLLHGALRAGLQDANKMELHWDSWSVLIENF